MCKFLQTAAILDFLDGCRHFGFGFGQLSEEAFHITSSNLMEICDTHQILFKIKFENLDSSHLGFGQQPSWICVLCGHLGFWFNWVSKLDAVHVRIRDKNFILWIPMKISSRLMKILQQMILTCVMPKIYSLAECRAQKFNSLPNFKICQKCCQTQKKIITDHFQTYSVKCMFAARWIHQRPQQQQWWQQRQQLLQWLQRSRWRVWRSPQLPYLVKGR